MNKHLLKITGLACLVLLLHSAGFAQKSRANSHKDTSVNHVSEYDEIIIKRKGNKDAKVTVEIKDGQVLVDGKPVSEYDNDDLSVRKKTIRVMDGSTFSFSGPGELRGLGSLSEPDMPDMPDIAIGPRAPGAPSPFRNRSGGGWSYDDDMLRSTSRAFLGVTSEEADGAKITQISKASAAEKAGLKIGDVITKIDEIKIDGPDALSEAVRKYKPEDKVAVTIKRDGKEQKITTVLGKTRTAQSYNLYKTPGAGNFNFDFDQMAPLNGFNWNNGQLKLGIKAQDTEEGKGVKVLDVNDESAAEKAGIKEGDIITRFDGKEVNSAAELAEQARASKGKVTIKVSLLRDGKSQELEVKIPRKLKTANL